MRYQEQSNSKPTEIICYLLVRGRNFQDEHYETASRHARVRAKQLRKLGFKASVSALGPQVTSVGKVNMTMVSIHNPGHGEIPNPDRLERL
jgi:hypothetical protein